MFRFDTCRQGADREEGAGSSGQRTGARCWLCCMDVPDTSRQEQGIGNKEGWAESSLALVRPLC